jgi:hypothetical protein
VPNEEVTADDIVMLYHAAERFEGTDRLAYALHLRRLAKKLIRLLPAFPAPSDA